MHALPDGQDFIDLSEVYGFPKEDYWEGASGAPICRGDSEEIVGILQIVRNNTGGHRLRATAACRLFDIPELAPLFHKPESVERRRQFVEGATKALAKSVLAVRELAQECGLDRNADARAVAENLAALESVPESSKKLRAVYDQIRSWTYGAEDQKKSELKEAREAIETAVQWIVPCLCNKHIDINSLQAKLSGELKIIDLPCVISTVAEIYIAFVERRSTAYRPREGEADWPEGIHHMPWRDPPFEGMDELISGRSDLHDLFGNKLAAGDIECQVATSRLDDFMIRTLAYSAAFPKDKTYRKKRAARELESQAKNNFRRYLLCRIPADNGSRRKELEDMLAAIATDYPAMVIVRLYTGSGVPEPRDDEFDDFKSTLPLASDQQGGSS